MIGKRPVPKVYCKAIFRSLRTAHKTAEKMISIDGNQHFKTILFGT
jgi:hypothetical protein